MDLTPALEDLNERECMVVEARLRGLTIAATAALAGLSVEAVHSLLRVERVKKAIKRGREISAEYTAITREKLTEMLMEAWRACATATEQTLVVRELAKLHGLNAAQKLEIDHSHRLTTVTKEQELRQLSVLELERLARQHGKDVIEGEYAAVPRLSHAEEA